VWYHCRSLSVHYKPLPTRLDHSVCLGSPQGQLCPPTHFNRCFKARDAGFMPRMTKASQMQRQLPWCPGTRNTGLEHLVRCSLLRMASARTSSTFTPRSSASNQYPPSDRSLRQHTYLLVGPGLDEGNLPPSKSGEGHKRILMLLLGLKPLAHLLDQTTEPVSSSTISYLPASNCARMSGVS
jgi:hypothetical protein